MTEYTAWIWLILGILLMLLEMAIPGMVVIFLGMGAILVAILGSPYKTVQGTENHSSES